MIKNLDGANFFENISKGLKLVCFSAPWCGYCTKQKAILNEMNEILIYSVDSGQSPEIIYKFKITSFPTFIIFQNGEEINRFLGLHDKYEIMNILTKYMK